MSIEDIFTVRWPFVATFALTLGPVGYLGVGDVSLKHDKLVHFTVFSMMTLLTYMCLSFEQKWRVHWIVVCGFGCCIIAAVGSEFMQHLINPNRSFDVYDIYTNVAGSIIGLSIGVLITFKTSIGYELINNEPDIELQSRG